MIVHGVDLEGPTLPIEMIPGGPLSYQRVGEKRRFVPSQVYTLPNVEARKLLQVRADRLQPVFRVAFQRELTPAQAGSEPARETRTVAELLGRPEAPAVESARRGEAVPQPAGRLEPPGDF